MECNEIYSNEKMVVELNLENNTKMALILAYRPPNYDRKLGDFNIPGVDWSSSTVNNNFYQHICDMLFDFGLTQVNTLPSRADNFNVLDLILTNKPQSVNNIETEIP